MNARSFWVFAVLIVAAIALVAGGSYFFPKLGENNGGPVACTQEAKLCPDGSAVGRTGPNCEFAACPAVSSTTSTDTSTWKTYTSGEFGFSFKYPPSWQKSADVLSVANPHIYFGDPLSGIAAYRMSITVENNPQDLSAQDFVKQLLTNDAAQDASNSASGPSPRVSPQFDKQYAVTIGSVTGYELYNVFEFDHNAEQVYIQQNKQMLVIDFPVADANPNIADPAGNNTAAHQILATLQVDPTIWKFCGGIAAFPCGTGYSCKLDGTYPDAGGHCVVQ